jgi:hypothetical protein
MKLMEEAKISPDEKTYGVEHIPKVQKFYDEKYPGMYRIIVMDNNPEIKPLWVAPLNEAKYQVVIYHESEHYDALKSVAKYFGGPRTKYCVDCAIFYDRDINHRYRCKARCIGCSKVRNGKCPDQEGVSMYCFKCSKNFKNW